MRIVVILVFLCLTNFCLGQTNKGGCTCEEEAIYEREFYQKVEQYDSLGIEKILLNLEAMSSPYCDIVMHNWQLYWAMRKNDLGQARLQLDLADSLLQVFNCTGLLLAHHLRVKGEYYLKTDQLDSVTVTYLRELEIERVFDDFTGQALTYHNLAVVFARLRQSEKSFSYNRKAYELIPKVTNQYRLATLLGHIAYSYAYQAQIRDNDSIYLDTALMIAHQCLATAKATQNDDAHVLGIRVLEAAAFYQGNYALAIAYCDSLLTKMRPRVAINFRQISGVFNVKSDNYKELGDLENAKNSIDSAIVYAEKFGNIAIQLSHYEKQYEILVLQKQFQEALNAYQTMSSLKDSLESRYNREKINELELKYEKIQNERKIKELNQEREITKLRELSLWILIALFLLLVPAIILYFRQRILQGRYNILEVEQRLNRARMNPHLFFNSLASLQSVALHEKDTRTLSSYLSKYARIMRATLESTFKELVTLEEEVTYLEQYLDIQKKLHAHQFDYQLEVSDELEAYETLLPGMIIQPFVENAIEHGFKDIDYRGNLSIRFYKQEEQLLVELSDNGSGLSKQERKTNKYPSRATEIIKDRLFLLNKKHGTDASFRVDPRVEQGLRVLIRLPLL